MRHRLLGSRAFTDCTCRPETWRPCRRSPAADRGRESDHAPLGRAAPGCGRLGVARGECRPANPAALRRYWAGLGLTV